MTNVVTARQILEAAWNLGARDFCVCSGSRNSPLLVVLGAAWGVGITTFVDERSAAFFALGRARRDGRPAAVITTSGTAVAELLPAVVEAYYARVPLILITADRPARFRGTGAPQAIDQQAIFGPYAARAIEAWDRCSPLHLNIEFDEPLIDGKPVPWSPDKDTEQVRDAEGPELSAPRISFRRPVVIASGLTMGRRDMVRDFIRRLNAPLYAEPTSGLREDPLLSDLAITAGDRMLHRGSFDGVIRIGGVPAIRFWRDLEESRSDLPVMHFSDAPFRGLTRGKVYSLKSLARLEVPAIAADRLIDDDRLMARRIAEILDSEPQSELAMIRTLSRDLPHDARVYLGNSLPIREWDLVATRDTNGRSFEANRGANGIDGQLSTFFGWCAAGPLNVAVLGDLTALYDAGAAWVVPQLHSDFRIVIVNNFGGRIFSRVPSLRGVDEKTRVRLIETTHDLRFDAWAAMWGIEERVTELRPDPAASERAWKRYDELWA
ncbi:MAG TPA: thiamine pyrophosphate-binding protein [Thermoanaerobaculia bacterium]|nr:thiamine pyrophosphate-binding protein [Thermoanaerobaculia bacterium]